MTVSENLEQKIVNRKRRINQDDISDEDLVKKWDEITERIKGRKPDCPLDDGEKGSFVKFLGWRGDALYKCPKGHEFAMRGEIVEIRKGN